MPARLRPDISDALFASLAHLGFQRFSPHPGLLSWVQCYWIAQQPDWSSEPVSETVYPDGGSTLIFNFSADNDPPIIFNSLQTTRQMRFGGQVQRLGIRFQPGGAFQLLNVVMQEVIDGDSALDDVSTPRLRSSLRRLCAQLSETTPTQQRLSLIDQWLLKRAETATHGMVQAVFPSLMNAQESIDALSSQLPISRRQLERKFQQEVGASPAQLQQLHRIKLARALISSHPEQSLTRIGQDAGFYDQAHFNRRFQRVTGLTPGEYRLKKMSQKYNSIPD